MAVYVDNLRVLKRIGNRGSWRFSHMIADTRDELDKMAELIDLDQKWKQNPGEGREHFDVTENYRQRALDLGAKQITVRRMVLNLQPGRSRN